MKNLENYGVQTLDVKELRVVYGGQLSGYYYNQGYNKGHEESFHGIGDFLRGVSDALSD